MSRLALRAGMAVAAAVAAALGPAALGQVGPAGAAVAGGPGTWTKIAVTDSGFNQAGMLRTADGALHLVWRTHQSNGHFSYGWSTVSLGGKLRASGVILSNWVALQGDPKLVPDHRHIRLIFVGGQDFSLSNFFSRGSVYTETSSNGRFWVLVRGTLANHTVLNRGLGAAVEKDGATPVAAFGLNNVLYFHEGIDPAAPAMAADGTAATGPVATGIDGDVLARDKNGSIWVGWFDQSYFARQILPSPGATRKAPHSGAQNGPDNSPRQQVAFAARLGGGVYLAYCSPAAGEPCSHINLWRIGSGKVLVVPGSATGHAQDVALAAAPGGRMWVSWFDAGTATVHAVRTNKAGTRFGVRRVISQPPATFIFNELQAEGSSGRLDVIVNVLLNTKNNPIEFWHTQILAGLTLTARPGRFSHRVTTSVTFTVTDAGDAVARAAVSCLGKHGTTNAHGQVKLRFTAGTHLGTHVCTATMTGYQPGKTTVKVT